MRMTPELELIMQRRLKRLDGGDGLGFIVRHSELKGKDRLCNVVDCLGKACPWTLGISSKQMINWLRSELDELEKELNLFDKIMIKKETLGKEEEDNDNENAIILEKSSLISEMGDILFDALMLEMIVRREYDLEQDTTWNTASEKVERRTPYMKEWGDGVSIATTAEEAEVIWKKVKDQEKAKELPKNLHISDESLSKHDEVHEICKSNDELICETISDKDQGKESTGIVNKLDKSNSGLDMTVGGCTSENKNIFSIEKDQEEIKKIASDANVIDEKNSSNDEVLDYCIKNLDSEYNDSNQKVNGILEYRNKHNNLGLDQDLVDSTTFKKIVVDDDGDVHDDSSSLINQHVPRQLSAFYSVVTSASVGFATGALMMALLQKVRVR
mmetsp:Transcript_4277/g.5555  ORF Transcript_4277/g.5555 Transcript_4277/m.5555 type:complete len:386 (-) Transcript_4277:41-1198(-)